MVACSLATVVSGKGGLLLENVQSDDGVAGGLTFFGTDSKIGGVEILCPRASLKNTDTFHLGLHRPTWQFELTGVLCNWLVNSNHGWCNICMLG